MSQITVEEAAARLPDIINGSRPGEEIVLTERDLPVAKLITLPKPRRKAGSAKHLPHHMADDFDAIPEGFEEYA